MTIANKIEKKSTVHFENYKHYTWELTFPEKKSGVHAHGKKDKNGVFVVFGFEIHSPKPLCDGQTSLPNCHITGGDCFHEGSSLYAIEKIGHINPDDPLQDQYVFNCLDDFYNLNS